MKSKEVVLRLLGPGTVPAFFIGIGCVFICTIFISHGVTLKIPAYIGIGCLAYVALFITIDLL